MKQYKKVMALLLTLVLCMGVMPISAMQVKAEAAQEISIISASGYEEGAYVTFNKVAGADGYVVSYKYATEGEFVKIDNELIREYPDCMRADILGLKSGSQVIVKVEAVTVNEDKSVKSVVKSATTENLSISAYDRSGFAFIDRADCGAYNADGTLKDDTVVLYLTDYNKDDITLKCVNKNGEEVSPVGIQNILDIYKEAGNNKPLCIRLIGCVTDPVMLRSGEMFFTNNFRNESPITLEGVGDDAVADGFGIRVNESTSVEFRNIAVINCDSIEGDSLGVDKSNHVWVHNMETYYGYAGADEDQKKGDGSLDCRWSDLVTFSYNHFVDSGKCNLLSVGPATEYGKRISYHHNWYDHTDSRNPRARYYTAHVYNNYYDGVANYGIGAAQGASVFSEANYFRNVKVPMAISFQGSEGGSSLSKEPGGIIKAYANVIEGGNYTKYSESNKYNFDAYEVADRNEKVPETVIANCKSDGTPMEQADFIAAGTKESIFPDYGYATPEMRKYNNFDTDPGFYTYTPDAAADIPTIVTAKAGTHGGMAVPFTFTALDDSLGVINAELEKKVRNYEGSVVSVCGINSYSGKAPVKPHGELTISENGVAHEFPVDYISSSYFDIKGNLDSNHRSSATYEGESKYQTSKGAFILHGTGYIKFKTSKVMKLVIVGANKQANKVLLDGKTLNAASGIFTKGILPGEHAITPDPSQNATYLFMVYVLPNTEEYTVNVATDNGEADKTLKVKGGDELTADLIPLPKKDGYTFTGWTNEAGEEIFFPYPVAENVKIVANYQKNGTKVTATNLALNLAEQEPRTIGMGTSVEINGFTITARSDKDWAIENKSTIVGGDTYTKYIDTKGQTKANDGGIKFNNVGVTTFEALINCAGKVELYCNGALEATFETPSTGKISYKLTKDGTYEIKAPAAKMFVADLKVISEPSCTLTLNGMGGVVKDNKLVIKDAEVTVKPEDPVKAGYEFTGWFTEYECITPFVFGEHLSADTYIFAGWKKSEGGSEAGGGETGGETGGGETGGETGGGETGGGETGGQTGGGEAGGTEIDNDIVDVVTSIEGCADSKRVSLKDEKIVVSDIKPQTYTGANIRPKFTVKKEKTVLVEGLDYTVIYKNNKEAGTATIILTGSGLYKDSLEKTFTIAPKSAKKLKAYAGSVMVNASASDIENAVKVFDGNKLLTKDQDYTVDITGAVLTKKGNAKVLIKGVGNYDKNTALSVSVPVLETIADKAVLSSAEITKEFVYNTAAQKITVDDVKVYAAGSTEAVDKSNYSVAVKNNKDAGTAIAIIKAKGKLYQGTVAVPFAIKPVGEGITLNIDPIKTVIYTGKLVRPKLKVTAIVKDAKGNDKKVTLKQDKDFVAVYENNLRGSATANQAKAKITGIGNFAGIKTEAAFTIDQQLAKKIKVKTDKDKNIISVTYGNHELIEGVDYVLEGNVVKPVTGGCFK